MAPLPDQLAALGLRYTAAHLDDVVALATKRRWSVTQLLEHLVEREQHERTRRSLERRLARSRLGRFTPMSDFDWAWPKRIDRAAVEAALRLDFLADARNVVLVAAQGLGKTMIAQNIAPRRRPRRHPRALHHRRPALARPRQPGLDPRPGSAPQPLRHPRAAPGRRDRVPLLRRARRRPPLPGRQPQV